jgi:Leucine-rich repeat (LRR) protein
MKNLSYLDLTKNKLRYLPDEICECNKLTDLHLSENILLSIPDMIGNFILVSIIIWFIDKLIFIMN